MGETQLFRSLSFTLQDFEKPFRNMFLDLIDSFELLARNSVSACSFFENSTYEMFRLSFQFLIGRG